MTDRVRMTFNGPPGTPWLSTLYFDRLLGGNAQASADAAWAFWEHLLPQIANDVALAQDAFVTVLDPVGGEVTGVEPIEPNSGVGGASGDPLPWQTQSIVNWHTGSYTGGREVRGRTFVPAPVETYNETGVPDGTQILKLTEAAALMVGLGTGTMVLWSPKNGLFYPIVAADVPAKWMVLRSRRD